MSQEAEWIAKDSQDNAEATATKAAQTLRRHVVTAVTTSFSGTATKLLQLKHGTTVVWEHYVVNAAAVPIPTGFRNGGVNEAVSAVLAASGSGGTVGKVNLFGYTI